MALPTSYDYNGFAGFLHDEVLNDVADSMGWEYEAGSDTVPTPVTFSIQTNGATVDNDTQITVDALSHAIPKGALINFTGHSTTYIEQGPGGNSVGATSINVFPYVNGVIPDNTAGVVTIPVAPPATHPVYRAITEEALLQMGLTTISQVDNERDIKRLRALGRIEAWHYVCANTVGDIFYEAEGAGFNRDQVHFNALDQWSFAQQDYERMFGLSTSIIPTFEISSQEAIKVVW